MTPPTTNQERERAFLRYLDAFDTGDVDGIQHFLELAADDAQLESMLLDFHAQESQPESLSQEGKIMPISDLVPVSQPKQKRKRRPRRAWRWGAVAATLLAIVGGFIGYEAFNNPYGLPADLTCAGVVLDNTITLYGEETERRDSLTTGVNQPFWITRSLGVVTEDTRYVVNYDDLYATIDADEIQLRGNCGDQTRIQVYPRGFNTEDACTVFIPDERADVYDVRVTEDSQPRAGGLTISEPLTLVPLDNGDYAFEMGYLTGILDGNDVFLRGECANTPLLYVPTGEYPAQSNGYGWHD